MVDPQTRTVPLLAQTDNPDGLLKPGHVRADPPGQPGHRADPDRPQPRVVEIESKKGVFVPAEKGTGRIATFTFLPVETGRDAGDRVVVKSGLNEGDRRRRQRRVLAQERADPPERDG